MSRIHTKVYKTLKNPRRSSDFCDLIVFAKIKLALLSLTESLNVLFHSRPRSVGHGRIKGGKLDAGGVYAVDGAGCFLSVSFGVRSHLLFIVFLRIHFVFFLSPRLSMAILLPHVALELYFFGNTVAFRIYLW